MNTLCPTRLCWQPISLSLAGAYHEIATREASQSADFAFANLYMWDETFCQEIALYEGLALVRFAEGNGAYRYLFPLGGGAVAPAIALLLEECRQGGHPLRLVGVTEAQYATLPEELANLFAVTESRDYEDYIYDAVSLATLTGKKLHTKRNHINAFTAANDWTVAPLSPNDFEACRAVLRAWDETHLAQGAEGERRAVERAFSAFEALGLFGVALRIGGQIVAFSLGEMLRPDTLCVHFEKALPDFRGAYPVINRELVRLAAQCHPALRFVNREDDMGLENLRKAKLSYHPLYLVKKYVLTEKKQGL